MLFTALLLAGALGLGAAELSSPIYPARATASTTTQSRWTNESTSTTIPATSTSSTIVSLLTPSTNTHPDIATISFTLFDPSSSSGPNAPNSTAGGNGNQTVTSSTCVESTEGVFYVTTTITTFIGTVFVAPNATVGPNSTSSTVTGPTFCSVSPKGFSSTAPFAASPTANPFSPTAASITLTTITSTNAISVVLTSPTGPAVDFTLTAPGSGPTPARQPLPPANMPGTSSGNHGEGNGNPSGGDGNHPSSSNTGGSGGGQASGSGSNGSLGPPSTGGGGTPAAGSGSGHGNPNGSPGLPGSGSSSGGFPGSGNAPGSVSGPSLSGSGVIINGDTVSQDPSHNIVLQGATFTGGSEPTPIVLNGQSWTLLPSNAGVVAPGGMTLSASAVAAGITPAPSLPLGPQGIQLDPSNPSQIVIAGSTIALPTSGSSVLTVAGETYTLGPSAIIAGSSTVPLSNAAITPAASYTAATVDGVPFDIGSTIAIINGQTLSIGPGAPTTTLTIGSETVIAGPNGIIFPTTTIAPLPMLQVVDGITLSLEASDVVISGTTYPFSKATTLVLGGTETIAVGSGGVGFPHTTLDPMAGTATSLPSLTQVGPKVTGGGAAASASPTNAASASWETQGLLKMYRSVIIAGVVGLWFL